jgi:hypothetical protein
MRGQAILDTAHYCLKWVLVRAVSECPRVVLIGLIVAVLLCVLANWQPLSSRANARWPAMEEVFGCCCAVGECGGWQQLR